MPQNDGTYSDDEAQEALDEDLAYDASDPRDIEAAERRQRRCQEQIDTELLHLLQTKGGRYFVWRLLERTHMYQDCPDTDKGTMARFLGRRSVGIETMRELDRVFTTHPKLYNMMAVEAAERDEERKINA